jgi:glutaminase
MSESLLVWLDLWGEWLDELLASGIATPSQTTRQRMHSWIQVAETLGYQDQVQAAHELLAADTRSERRAELFYYLLVQQDLLQRLYNAQSVCDRYTDQE